MFRFFGSKKKIERLKKEVQDSFNHVKKDFNKVGDWIKHLDDKHGNHEKEISSIKLQLYDLSNRMDELKEMFSFFNPGTSDPLSKREQTGWDKQSEGVYVQTPVQTPVQTGDLAKLTVMERAIIWALLNTNMRLSYEDLASLLGKEKSTIRGQINTIKQKNPGIVKEFKEPTGKKRLFIPENFRSIMLKKIKVRVKKDKKNGKE